MRAVTCINRVAAKLLGLKKNNKVLQLQSASAAAELALVSGKGDGKRLEPSEASVKPDTGAEVTVRGQ